MATRIGFYLFVGLFLGAVIGAWLPFAASLESIAGGVLAVLVGLVLDRRDAKRRAAARASASEKAE